MYTGYVLISLKHKHLNTEDKEATNYKNIDIIFIYCITIINE